ncbi:MAG: YihY/virulence factor BrkB family protein [Acidobacteriota bacterium]
MHIDGSLLRKAAAQCSAHNVPRLGAALAFYAVLSLAPTLILFVALCGFLFGEDAVRGQLFWQVRGVIGDQAASAVQAILKSADRPASGIGATLAGFLVLLLGASGVFVELRGTLNYIWDAPAQQATGLSGLIRERFFSFAMVLGCGLLLIVSLIFSVFVQAAGSYGAPFISVPAPLLEAGNATLTFLATTLLFALIYRFMPDVRVDWQDVAMGSLVTAVLFGIGRFLIGLYLGKAGVASPYGAAGSLIALLIWTYYSAQIFLFGAEFTRECARHGRSTDGTVNASVNARVPASPPPIA